MKCPVFLGKYWLEYSRSTCERVPKQWPWGRQRLSWPSRSWSSFSSPCWRSPGGKKGGCKRISLQDVLCALADVRGEKNSIGIKRWPKGWGESYFWRITPSHQHLLYFEFKFQAKPQVCTKHFTNNIFEIMKNYRKYDKDISDDGDQDEKNNCCLDMSIWTLSVSFFLMSHFGHLGLHYGWFFTVWKLVYYLFYFHITCWLFTRHAQKQRHLRR